MIQQATCDLILVKLGKEPQAFPQQLDRANKWLIPYAGGGNIHKAMTIFPALAKLYASSNSLQVELCQVSTLKKVRSSAAELQKAVELIQNKMNLPVKKVDKVLKSRCILSLSLSAVTKGNQKLKRERLKKV